MDLQLTGSACSSPAAPAASAAPSSRRSPTRAPPSGSAPGAGGGRGDRGGAARAGRACAASGRRRRRGGARRVGGRVRRRRSAGSTPWSPTSARWRSRTPRRTGSASFNVDLMHTVRLVQAALPHLEAATPRLDRRDLQRLRARVGLRLGALRDHEDRDRRLHPGPRRPAGRHGVRANTVSPGNTYFEGGVWADDRAERPGALRDRGGAQPDRADGNAGGGRAGRWSFLASPVAGRISGTNLVVDGALTRGIQL